MGPVTGWLARALESRKNHVATLPAQLLSFSFSGSLRLGVLLLAPRNSKLWRWVASQSEERGSWIGWAGVVREITRFASYIDDEVDAFEYLEFIRLFFF